jgi:hypothetical protein
MENEQDTAGREQVLEQAFAAYNAGSMDQAQDLFGQVANNMMASRYALLKRMGLFDEDDQTNKD